jgi:hypothetical protein
MRVIPIVQRKQMKPTVDLDRKCTEVGVNEASSTRSVDADRLLQRWWESYAARDFDEVDLTEGVGAAFDVSYYREQIGTVLDWARGENLSPQHGRGYQPLLN